MTLPEWRGVHLLLHPAKASGGLPQESLSKCPPHQRLIRGVWLSSQLPTVLPSSAHLGCPPSLR